MRERVESRGLLCIAILIAITESPDLEEEARKNLSIQEGREGMDRPAGLRRGRAQDENASMAMSSSPSERMEERERESRSLALEKSYVHDPYQHMASHFADDADYYKAWPKVKQFLLDLEPGSFVCDAGCGDGKYLGISPRVFKVGSDRCHALCAIAREKGHEVTVCDTVSLPFRDEAFDAALSVAVIHHLATTKRRIQALRELTRVLRIGGRLLITVWAVEQKHRKDRSGAGKESESGRPRVHRAGQPLGHVLRIRSSRAPGIFLAKLAGGRRSQGGRKSSLHLSRLPSDSTDADDEADEADLPIELRMIDYSVPEDPDLLSPSGAQLGHGGDTKGFAELLTHLLPFPLRPKGRPGSVVSDSGVSSDTSRSRSRSSFSEFGGSDTRRSTKTVSFSTLSVDSSGKCKLRASDGSEEARDSAVYSETSEERLSLYHEDFEAPQPPIQIPKMGRKPLLKQKQSIYEDIPVMDPPEKPDRPFAILEEEGETVISEDFGRFKARPFPLSSTRIVIFKQASLNEELLSKGTQKLPQRALPKQTSLNENLLAETSAKPASLSVGEQFQRRASTGTGTTTTTTAPQTKVESMQETLRNGFAKIFQSWRSESGQFPRTVPGPAEARRRSLWQRGHQEPESKAGPGRTSLETILVEDHRIIVRERKMSREENSDSSSKDNSFQSDASMDSEDSFVSVIYVPKPEKGGSLHRSMSSESEAAPASPRSPISPRSPNGQQSSRSQSLKFFQSRNPSPKIGTQVFQPGIVTPQSDPSEPIPDAGTLPSPSLGLTRRAQKQRELDKLKQDAAALSARIQARISKFHETHPPPSPLNLSAFPSFSPKPSPESLLSIPIPQDKTQISSLALGESIEIIRKAGSQGVRTQHKTVPRILELELFNPVTDDLSEDTDDENSSSPSSVASVISVVNEDWPPDLELDDPADPSTWQPTNPFLEDVQALTGRAQERSSLEHVERLATQLSEDILKSALDQFRPRLYGRKWKRDSDSSSSHWSTTSNIFSSSRDSAEDERDRDSLRRRWKQTTATTSSSSSIDLKPLPPLRRKSPTSAGRPMAERSSSSATTASEDSTELGDPAAFRRFYHLFRKEELDSLIQKYVQNLHIISSYRDHSNWCVIAEKVQVWTI
ncbi:unnamed protein product [Darwinula stevensoni]|uniref:Methyltransferase type 11 domain-containing protein n=1 Tax=Darwinula stevensoni TaxID=69355 RepID=A0A7R8XBQ8_9CRUS|nr:unnamed protein product [Darwinula stevensoni]CAG0893027.1 unnamed protein product [Darwinula stevensoni]